MCDTFGALSAWTGTGQAIFGKNSDREPDETQLVVSIPRMEHGDQETVRCTYVTIPQARATHAVLLSQPFWMWGAEMGVNEKGVVIGNEAIFTKVKSEKKPGLIGMDLLRLALERADTARGACEVIVALLKQYGQYGPCGYRDKRMTYMNSFLFMDRGEIIVLETVGRDYAFKTYKDYAAISNTISLETDWDEASLPGGTNVKSFRDPFMTYFAGGSARRLCSLQQVMERYGRMDIPDAFALLRMHNPGLGFNRDVCMHAQGPLIRRSQTTGSLVVAFNPEGLFKIFVTAGSAPCLTPFKPVLPGHLPADISRGSDHYAEDSSWWRHEAFHVNALFHDGALREVTRSAIEKIEKRSGDIPFYPWDSHEAALIQLSQDVFSMAEQKERDLLAQMKGGKQSRSAYWLRIAKRNKIPLV